LEDPWIAIVDGEKKEVQKIERLEFSESELIPRIQKKTKAFLKKNDRKKLNAFSSALFCQDFLINKTPDVEIKKVDSIVGMGVFAKTIIPRLSYVGEYVGIVRRRNRLLDPGNPYIFRYLRSSLFCPLVVDAREKGNFTRFINHSDEPNLTSRWLIVDGVYHIILFSNQMILPGTQITYDYGESYWRKKANPIVL
jgi:SET domain-containing protein